MRPWRRVVRALIRAGASIIKSEFKYRWWELDLECGHTVERRIKYLPPADGSRPTRGYGAQWQGVPTSRLPEQRPRRARCEQCPVEP